MKTIGIVAYARPSAGGVYQYAHSLIDALKNDKEHKYIVFCRSNDERFDNYNLEIRKFDRPPQKKYWLLALKFSFLRRFYLSKEEKKLFADIDLFISPQIAPYPYSYLKKPFLFTLHDIQEKYYPEFFSKKELKKRAILNSVLAKEASMILCESNYVKNDIIKFTDTASEKIEIIQAPPPQNFVDFQFDNEGFEKIKEKYKLPKKFLFYPAQCWYHKNHIKLIEAFELVTKEYPDVHLVFTGAQKNNYKNVIDKVNELNLKENVHHLGYIDYEDLPYIYKLSQMLIVPSLFESVSIPIYEAFSLKVPVCCSNILAFPEQTQGAALLFDPNDITSIKNAIITYLKNPSIALENAEKGYHKVKSFNHRYYSDRLKTVIDTVSKGKS